MNPHSRISSGSVFIFGLSYDYGYGVNNNGQIRKITDSVQPGRTVTYTYDELMRLASAVTDGSTAYPKWGLSFTYDRYGNRTAQNVTSGSGYNVPLSFEDGSHTNINRILASTYDSSGNMTLDGTDAYEYDAENRLVDFGNGGATYAFDGNGLRVKRTYSSATTVYIFNGSQAIAEYASGAAPTAPTREYIYAGALLAKIEGANTTYYYPDHLSNRMTKAGSTTAEQGHYPFGESWYGSPDKWQFTSYERDTESGNDYADFRSYVNRYGRFLTPDPAGTAAADLTNPQSWNQYAYALNDPIGLIDPLGLCPAPGVYWKKCLYVQRVDGGFNCGVDGVMTDCSLVFSLIASGAGYPSSTPEGECYQVNGQIYCGKFYPGLGDTRVFVGSKFNPNAYLSTLFFPLASANAGDGGAANNENPKKPLCVAVFGRETIKSFGGVPFADDVSNFLAVHSSFLSTQGVDLIGALATATASTIQSAQVVPATKALRGGLSVMQWSRASGAKAATKGGWVALLAFADAAMAQGLWKEYQSLKSGQCRAIGQDY